jgi:hypothetical protein
MARSRIAEQLQREQVDATLAMTPQERVDLAFKLGRQAVEMYMLASKVDHDTASRALKKAGQAGRRYSRCMDEDATARK